MPVAKKLKPNYLKATPLFSLLMVCRVVVKLLQYSAQMQLTSQKPGSSTRNLILYGESFHILAMTHSKEKGDAWKIKMKYFQNVVDIVRDLMSPVAQEQNYKQGMRKDKDGFTDISWCSESIFK